MTQQKAGNARTIFTWALRIPLGLLCLVIGVDKLIGGKGTIQYFNLIGWGQWFRYATGALEVIGGLLIFVPRLTSYGALIITCVLGLGAILAFSMQLSSPLLPVALTILAGLLAWLASNPSRH